MCQDAKVKEYISLLYNSDKLVRENATKSLIECGKKSVLPLMNVLDDPDWIVRYRATEALGLIKDERALNSLTRKLKDAKDHVRYMAAKGLGFFDNKELSLSLVPLLRDENEYVRRITAQSLGNIGGNTAYNSLLKAEDIETDMKAKDAMKAAILKIGSKN
ncbi:MAG: HEAT repeat domain-containing protein [Methanomicrobium sp.]|nr:HEAT repeat domain-containing protein [Methanomicrobium sp.]